MRWVAATCGAIALLTSAIACQSLAGLADFQPQSGGGGEGAAGPGDGGGSPSSQATTGTGGSPGVGGEGGSGAGSTASGGGTSSTTTTSSGGGSGGGGAGCDVDHLVISEVRTRGPDDGNQDFIELFNPTSTAVELTADFHVDARGEDAQSYGDPRWSGDGTIVIQPGKHVLLTNDAGDNPIGGATPDDVYHSGIPDGASVVLYQGTSVLDAVCFTCKTTSLGVDYVCERPELTRSSACSVAGDASVQRNRAGTVDGCADTDDNSADLSEGPSTPAGSID